MGWLAKWAIELEEFDIEYKPHPSIKAKVLADFIIKCIIPDEEREEKKLKEEPTTLSWVLYVDGALNAQTSGAGLILTSPDGIVMEYALRFSFHITNNGTKYKALIASLNIAKEIDIK